MRPHVIGSWPSLDGARGRGKKSGRCEPPVVSFNRTVRRVSTPHDGRAAGSDGFGLPPLLAESQACIDQRTDIFLKASFFRVSPNRLYIEIVLVPPSRSVHGIRLSANADRDPTHTTRAFAPEDPGVNSQRPAWESRFPDRLRAIITRGCGSRGCGRSRCLLGLGRCGGPSLRCRLRQRGCARSSLLVRGGRTTLRVDCRSLWRNGVGVAGLAGRRPGDPTNNAGNDHEANHGPHAGVERCVPKGMRRVPEGMVDQPLPGSRPGRGTVRCRRAGHRVGAGGSMFPSLFESMLEGHTWQCAAGRAPASTVRGLSAPSGRVRECADVNEWSRPGRLRHGPSTLRRGMALSHAPEARRKAQQ